MSLNMFSDSAKNEGNIAYMQQCGFHWSIAVKLEKSDEEFHIWLQSGKIIEHCTRKPKLVLFLLLALNGNDNNFSSGKFSQDFRIAKVE